MAEGMRSFTGNASAQAYLEKQEQLDCKPRATKSVTPERLQVSPVRLHGASQLLRL
ncbi:hypothetical protein ABBQ38_011871 [Trebouxia sp. C0009 RCD-2024]